MSLTPELVDAMLAQGLTREQMAALVKAELLAARRIEEEKEAAKRANNAERQRRFKAKKRAESNADNALPPLPRVTAVTNGSTEPYSETVELNNKPKQTRTRKAAPRFPFPEDWNELSDDEFEFAHRKRGWTRAQADQQFERFRDYNLRNGSEYADWKAAWRTWVTSPIQDQAKAQPPPSGRANNGATELLNRIEGRHDSLDPLDSSPPFRPAGGHGPAENRALERPHGRGAGPILDYEPPRPRPH